MSGNGMRHDRHRDDDLVRDNEEDHVQAALRGLIHGKPPRRAVLAAEAFLARRDPWDEIKPR